MQKKGTVIAVLALTILVGAWAGAAPPNNVVGYNRIEVPADSDVVVSVPFNLNPKGSYTVVTVTGTGVTAAAGSFPDPLGGACYVRFTSGNANGLWTTITSNTTDTLVFDNQDAAFLSKIANGNTFAVYPHQTLGSVLPKKLEEFAFVASPDATLGNRKNEVLLPSEADGINKSATATYYYLKWNHPVLGLLEGWREHGQSVMVDKGGVIVKPDSYVILRNNGSKKLTFILKGLVPIGKIGSKVSTKAVQYDLNFATGRPLPVTLNKLGLEPVFAQSSTAGLPDRKDELLVFDNTDGKKNKSAAKTYYYLNWNHPTLGLLKGWREHGTDVREDKGNVEITPSQGLIIRKAAGTPADQYYTQSAPY